MGKTAGRWVLYEHKDGEFVLNQERGGGEESKAKRTRWIEALRDRGWFHTRSSGKAMVIIGS